MMKNIIYKTSKLSVLLLAIVFLLNSCEDDFMERLPADKPVAENAFETDENFRVYAWGLYRVLTKYDDKMYNEDIDAGYLFNGTANGENQWAFQKITPQNSSGDWNFEYLRSVNFMLDRIDDSKMTDAEKAHWRGVGYFFRSYRYMQMLVNFSDVNWLDRVITEEDTDILYGKRTPRDQVANQVLQDLKYAEEHVRLAANDDKGQIVDKHSVRALISRFGLIEGTWRKYHNLGNAETYLKASLAASTQLMKDFPDLHNNWGELFTSMDLAANKEMILYREYAESQTQHGLTRYARTSSISTEMTKKTIDGYLFTDGKTKWNSSDFEGDQGENAIFKEFRNRDRRLWYVVCPPYKVSASGGAAKEWSYLKEGDKATGENVILSAQDEKDFREHLDYFNQNMKGVTGKQLPVSNWAGYFASEMPHFRSLNLGQGFLASEGGYLCWMFYDEHVTPQNWQGVSDCPIFRMGEILLNYAEVQWELGDFNQDVANKTINRLRDRAGIAHMAVSNISANFDPTRDNGQITYKGANGSDVIIKTGYSVDPVLWEIRRERRNELMAQGFGYTDIRRWKKGAYLNEIQLGAWVDNKQYANIHNLYGFGNKANSKDKEGYIKYHRDPVVEAKFGWLDHYYLKPLPITQLVLNPNLEQNPGYPKE